GLAAVSDRQIEFLALRIPARQRDAGLARPLHDRGRAAVDTRGADPETHEVDPDHAGALKDRPVKHGAAAERVRLLAIVQIEVVAAHAEAHVAAQGLVRVAFERARLHEYEGTGSGRRSGLHGPRSCRGELTALDG